MVVKPAILYIFVSWLMGRYVCKIMAMEMHMLRWMSGVRMKEFEMNASKKA